jgi:hypothetical protein
MVKLLGSGRVAGVLGVVWIVLAVMAGCGDLAPGQQPGISGELVGRDDAGRPDYVVTGSVVVVPKRQGMAWFRATHPELRLHDLSHASIPFTPRQVRRMGGEVVTTDSGGHFRLRVPAGGYLLCFVHENWVATAGCDRIDLPARGTVRGEWSIGGFAARVE